MHPNLLALGAVALWASLASLGVALKHFPPFFLTGMALLIGSTLALPFAFRARRAQRMAWGGLALGVLTFFGFHFLLFIALRLAPAVEVNLVNYLWPLLMVVMAPLYAKNTRWRWIHVVAALLGFAGAAVAILGSRGNVADSAGPAGMPGAGYLMALGSALIWAHFSLHTKRASLRGESLPDAAIGLFGLMAGLLSLACHSLLEPAVHLETRDLWLLAAMGWGPLGAAFFLWDRALKTGDAQHIGLLSYLTPLASTVLLMLVSGQPLTWTIALAALMIIGAAVLGTRAQ